MHDHTTTTYSLEHDKRSHQKNNRHIKPGYTMPVRTHARTHVSRTHDSRSGYSTPPTSKRAAVSPACAEGSGYIVNAW